MLDAVLRLAENRAGEGAGCRSRQGPRGPEDAMRMSCIPVTFFREILGTKTMSREDWFKTAADVGLDGTEIYESLVAGLDASAMARLADAVRDAGLQVSMFSTENNFSGPTETAQATQQVRDAVDAAVIFETDIVRVTAASPFGASAFDARSLEGANRDDIVRSCAAGLRGCLDYAEEKRVMLAIEDHPIIGWNLEEFMRILELVNDERLKVNLDTSNFDPATIVDFSRQVADRVVHLHVKEGEARTGLRVHQERMAERVTEDGPSGTQRRQ
jgi:sugar phosphate isomerase/epimerase